MHITTPALTSLQLLQAWSTSRGKPVRVEISAIPPDVDATAVTELELRPNEFRQLGPC